MMLLGTGIKVHTSLLLEPYCKSNFLGINMCACMFLVKNVDFELCHTTKMVRQFGHLPAMLDVGEVAVGLRVTYGSVNTTPPEIFQMLLQATFYRYRSYLFHHHVTAVCLSRSACFRLLIKQGKVSSLGRLDAKVPS